MWQTKYALAVPDYLGVGMKIRLIWQTKYTTAVPKNLGLGLNFRPCSEGYFLSGRP